MEFITKIASYTPVPAGGAAVANCFCMAVALLYKVILFETERNVPPALNGHDLIDVKREIERLLRVAETLVDEDSEAYLNFVQSRRDGNPTQMQQHFSEIIEVSMKILEKSATAFEWIRQLHPIVSPNLQTHLLVAGELLMGSINATVHVVKANLSSIKTAEEKQGYLNRLNELHRDYHTRYRQIIDNFSSKPNAADPETGIV
jgi:formiminotetrahydrofolate cyclodeaminase